MTKKNKKPKPTGKPIAKFVVFGIIGAVIVAGLSYVALNPDSVKADNPSQSMSIDTRQGSPLLGSPDAPITIIEFGDYQCPFCKMWNTNTKPAVEKNLIETGKANLIYVDFAIIGPDSIKAHAGSYCAAEQGLYWQYHDYVYANQGHENDGWANTKNLKLLVSGVDGIDSESFSECIDSGKYEQRVRENTQIARDSGARSTPSFIVIGPSGQAVTITGAQPYTVFQQTVDNMIT